MVFMPQISSNNGQQASLEINGIVRSSLCSIPTMLHTFGLVPTKKKNNYANEVLKSVCINLILMFFFSFVTCLIMENSLKLFKEILFFPLLNNAKKLKSVFFSKKRCKKQNKKQTLLNKVF